MNVWLLPLLAAWLVPGAGHFMLKKTGRGALIFASVFLMFLFGLLMRGTMFTPEKGADYLTSLINYGGFVCNLAAGAMYLLTTMFGYAQPDWRAAWEGWTYVDAWSEDNPLLTMLRERAGEPADGIGGSGMGLAAGYDLGRLVVEALAGAEPLTRTGVKEAFERVKCLPAALGTAGTTMSFGQWDRAALKGGFLVLRRWQGGQSVRVTD